MGQKLLNTVRVSTMLVAGGLWSRYIGNYSEPNWPYWLGAAAVGTGVAAVLECYRERTGKQKSYKTSCNRALKKLLKAAAEHYRKGEDKWVFRANVMLKETDLSKPEGRRARRKVDSATAFNMDDPILDTDKDLSMWLFAGVGGKAMEEKGAVISDLTTADDSSYNAGLTPGEISQVRKDLKTIMAAPIHHPDSDDIIGTLQVDTTATVKDLGFLCKKPVSDENAVKDEDPAEDLEMFAAVAATLLVIRENGNE